MIHVCQNKNLLLVFKKKASIYSYTNYFEIIMLYTL